jgi:ribonuclease BN (tRNA processing enzyme)
MPSREDLVDGGGSFSDPAQRGETHGPDPGEEAVSNFLWSRGFKQIDVVALTHAHQDHIGGRTAVFHNFRVNTVWIGREVASPQQQQLERLAITAAKTRLFRTSLPPSSHVSPLFLPAKEILTDIPARNSSNAYAKLVFPPCAPTPTARFSILTDGKKLEVSASWPARKSRRRSIQRSRNRHRISRALSNNK